MVNKIVFRTCKLIAGKVSFDLFPDEYHLGYVDNTGSFDFVAAGVLEGNEYSYSRGVVIPPLGVMWGMFVKCKDDILDIYDLFKSPMFHSLLSVDFTPAIVKQISVVDEPFLENIGAVPDDLKLVILKKV